MQDIKFVRLDDDLARTLNQSAQDKGERVSDLVNWMLRDFLDAEKLHKAEGPGAG